MNELEKLVKRARRTKHGFLDIQKAANEVVLSHTTKESLRLARALFTSEVHQARALATFILGRLAGKSTECLAFLEQKVSKDTDWRVQETLAKAIDNYCSDIGYEHALPVIKHWLAHKSPNVRRAVSEGLRIWTGRPYFREHPTVAVKMLSQLRNDTSEYVRQSAGNALRDISKKHQELIRIELQDWDTSIKRIAQTYKLASKFINGKGAV